MNDIETSMQAYIKDRGSLRYLFFGGKDPLIPQEHVEKINKALADNEKAFVIKVYPEATHGFFCNERESYHPDAAKDSWEKFKSFFSQHLN